MKTYTVKDINKHNPCYNPTRHFDPNKSYTLLDFLNNETCPEDDKIWVVTRFLSDKENRLFAVWCARRALSRVDNPHSIVVHAVDIAEKYARGEATEEELRSAHDEVYWAITNTSCLYACWVAHNTASRAAYHAARWSDYWGSERKAQIEYLKNVVKINKKLGLIDKLLIFFNKIKTKVCS